MAKTALITGASGGIGYQTALLFAKNGYNIIYHYNKNKNDKQIETISKLTNCLAVKADFLNPDEILSLYETSIKTFGKIDCLVNNAAVDNYSLLIDETYGSILSTINTNLTASVYLTSLVSKNMIKFGGGNIINISSVYAKTGGSGESVYAATKSALIGFTKSLASELSFSNIRVNAVAPGITNTKMIAGLKAAEINDYTANLAIKRVANTEEIARVIYFLASDESGYISGETVFVDGGAGLC